MCAPLALRGEAVAAVEVRCAPLLAWAALAHLEVLLPVLRANAFFSRADPARHVFEVGTVFVENQLATHVGVYPPGRVELCEAVPGRRLRYVLDLPGAAAYFNALDREELIFELTAAPASERCRVEMRCVWTRTWLPLPVLPLVPLLVVLWHARVKLAAPRLRRFLKQNSRPSRLPGVLRVLERLQVPVPPDVATTA